MDAAVARAMARWPNVPDVFGWLSLDRRGQWRLQGGTIGNEALREFISRNYFAVGDGRYAFQNGPQRVFVELAYTPWIIALDGVRQLRLHTGAPVVGLDTAWIDEHGALLLGFESGVGLVDDRDLAALVACCIGADGSLLDDEAQAHAIDALLSGSEATVILLLDGKRLAVSRVNSAELKTRFAFDPQPRAPASADAATFASSLMPSA